MDSLNSLLRQLTEDLDAYERAGPTSDEQTVAVFHAYAARPVELLGWLKAQMDYPQFYFNFRDEKRQIAALGAVRRFNDSKAAQAFAHCYRVPLTGGVTFDGESRFCLPRLLLQQTAAGLEAMLFMDRERHFDMELRAARQTLKTLEKMTALLPLQCVLTLSGWQAGQAQWADWVAQALAAIRQGELSKVVLANQSHLVASAPLDGKDLLAASERQNTGCYHFLLAQNAERTFLGSSPECLYRRDGVRLETEALAGTAFVGADAQANLSAGRRLLQDEKNLYENQLVAEGIRRHLRPYASQIHTAEPELKPLRQVQHLRRKITARLSPGYGDADYLDAIHPTAAVSGFPRAAAMEFLQNTENFDRTWYAGALGIMQPERAEFCVAIRSAMMAGNKITVFAGAGIVEGSIPLLEWQEIEKKAAALVSLLKKSGS